jgi:mono/diheme cytochrome c family protein
MRVTGLFVLSAALISAAQVSVAHAQPPDGHAVFNAQCVACHQADAKGVPGNFPPLAGNPDLFLARDFPARMVLFGMSGKITVKGQQIDGTMPPLGGVLKDDEIAAVVNFVRGNFGNAALAAKSRPMPPLDAATVAALRKQKDADKTYEYRKLLKPNPKN